jgi:hypothetical protein
VVLKTAAAAGEFAMRLTVDPSLAGGLAIFGENFGRFPLDAKIALEPISFNCSI